MIFRRTAAPFATLRSWVALASTLASTSAVTFFATHARADCAPSAAVDAISSARRSRALLFDYLRFQRNLDADLAYIDSLAALDPDDPRDAHVYAAPAFDGIALGGYDVCTDRGVLPSRVLESRLALTVGFDLPSGWGARLTVMRGEDITRYGPDGRHATRFDTNGGAWGFGQTLWAARIGSSRVFEAMVGVSGPESETLTATPDGATLIRPADSAVLARGGAAYWLGGRSAPLHLGGGVHLQSNVIELATIDVDPFRLGTSGFSLGGAATYLREEKEGITALRLAYGAQSEYKLASEDGHHYDLVSPTNESTPETKAFGGATIGWSAAAEGSIEWNAPRFRHARLELDAFARAGMVGRGSGFTGGLDWHVFADATIFNGNFMLTTVGRSQVPGGAIGLRGIQGLRVGSVVFDVSGAVNRPETLALVPQAVGHPELRMQLFFRFGW